MATFARKFNINNFNVDTKDFNYVKLADIFKSKKEGGAKTVHAVSGLYVHKNELGDSPVIIDGEKKRFVNLPTHMGGIIREILADAEAVQLIKDGKVGYTIYEYTSHNKQCYSITWVDL